MIPFKNTAFQTNVVFFCDSTLGDGRLGLRHD